MGWSAGTFSRVHDWTSDEAGSFPNVESARMDQEDDNFATGINTCLAKDGQNTPTADLPMGANKHTGVGNGAARDHYAAINQIQDGDLYVATSVSGTDTIVGTMAPAISAYTNGMRVLFEPAANNTGAATLNLNSVGAQSITKNGATALAAGDLLTGVWADCVYDLSNTNWVLLNPQTQTVASTTSVIAGAGMTGGGTLASDATLNVIGGDGITANANDIALSTGVAGGGLTYTSGVLAVGAGTGITVSADSIAANPGAIAITGLSGYDANKYVDHTGVTFTAGAGLTGGGTIAATRDFAVGAGTGITVNANDVALSASVAGAGMTHTAGVLNVIGDASITVAANSLGLAAGVAGDGITLTTGVLALDATVAGTGMTHTSGVLNVIGGSGITANANDVALTNVSAGAAQPVAISAGTFSFDLSSITEITMPHFSQSADKLLVSDAGTIKTMPYDEAGIKVATVTGTTDTLAATDMNTFIEYTNASPVAVTLNTGVGTVGNVLLIKQTGAGQVTISGTATVEASIGQKTRAAHSVISLVCIAANTWALYGDAAA